MVIQGDVRIISSASIVGRKEGKALGSDFDMVVEDTHWESSRKGEVKFQRKR